MVFLTTISHCLNNSRRDSWFNTSLSLIFNHFVFITIWTSKDTFLYHYLFILSCLNNLQDIHLTSALLLGLVFGIQMMFYTQHHVLDLVYLSAKDPLQLQRAESF